jgi:hypothetical protein
VFEPVGGVSVSLADEGIVFNHSYLQGMSTSKEDAGLVA